jgi:4,5-dihydroxyphthalate decarboxylase
MAQQELGEIAALLVQLPWVVDHYNETRRLMGEDYWPYGFHENLKTLETFTRYSHQQGLSSRKVNPEELFARSTFELSKI